MYTDWSGWTLDFSGPQMILTIKLTTIAIDYYDGNRSKAEKEVRPPRYGLLLQLLHNAVSPRLLIIETFPRACGVIRQ
jgi:hypothetical protein